MSFLHKIDELHDLCKSKYIITELDQKFSTYINVKPIDKTFKNSFLIKKQEKAKLLIVSGKQRVYLSDYRILSTIMSLEKNDINWFLKSLIDFYNGQYKPFKFKINNEIFEGRGLDYKPDSSEILLYSDTKIDINELIFVINFVLSKDYQWEVDSKNVNFSKRTIIKYISLIDYYCNKSETSKDFLNKIGYPVNNVKFKNVKDIKNMFMNIDLFDVTKYM